MVLHDVAQRAIAVVIGPASAGADGFGDGDLHMLDGVLVPQRFEQRVGEAQRHQVLHRLLAEIVVDPEDAVFGEHLAERLLDLEAGFEVVAERLLDGDARALVRKARALQVLCDGTKEIGRGRKIENDIADVVELLGDRLVGAFLLGVAGEVGQPIGKARPHLVREQARGPLLNGSLHLLAEGRVVECAAGAANDREIRGQEAVGIEEIE